MSTRLLLPAASALMVNVGSIESLIRTLQTASLLYSDIPNMGMLSRMALSSCQASFGSDGSTSLKTYFMVVHRSAAAAPASRTQFGEVKNGIIASVGRGSGALTNHALVEEVAVSIPRAVPQ